MNDLMVIGIDSLAPELLIKYEKYLPNFNRLRENSPAIDLESIFPVDSVPAWASIYTGWNPARHGIVKTFDVFDSNLKDILSIDNNILRGKTFWDILSNYGYKVCVLFPLLAFPPWKVNGILLSKAIKENRKEGGPEWIIEKEVLASPSEIMDKYKIPRLMNGVSGKHPGTRNLNNWSKHAGKALIDEANIGLRICTGEEWDLFFIYFSWLDIIQHRLWRYCDDSDPTWPPGNPFGDIIRDFYIKIDNIVGKFLELYPETTTIVFSDHGHGMRPTKVVNINKILRENNLTTINNKSNHSQIIMERLKILALEVTRRLELDKSVVDLFTKTETISSLSKNVYMSTSSMKKNDTIAYLSAFAGVKSYPHGGIEINRDNLPDIDEYEELRDLLLKLLLTTKHPESEEKLVEWACRREDLYQGNNISSSYPDIVFQLKKGYGTGWNMYNSLVGRAYDHNLASGGHKKNAVFLISNYTKKVFELEISLMDIAPTILDIFEVEPAKFGFDGKSISTEKEI